ncbi:hypothetical protein BOVATA_000660 [Babesia ovata]|uniref:Uncharacterized protein n=1 Tax=Babesia ovata TaxID=189622 RepID=A0A2H6K6E9_9APIC|nr:uncharacterized protein BOVATA_000660 [Babesia ovata]GBE58573.1 hypothetical protein BOVATA_000660 [Babesia ovata]
MVHTDRRTQQQQRVQRVSIALKFALAQKFVIVPCIVQRRGRLPIANQTGNGQPRISDGTAPGDLNRRQIACSKGTRQIRTLPTTWWISVQERVKKLEDSLCGLQSNVESKRSNILEEIYQKINNLETKIAESEAQERRACSETNKKVGDNASNNHPQIDAIQRSVTAAKAKHEAETKEAVVKMEAVYQRFTETLRAEKEQWKQVENDAINDINSHIKRIRDDLEEMKKSKTHLASYLRQYIDNELPQLKLRVAAAGDDIAAMEKTIITNTHDDLLTLASFIKQETMQLNEMKRSTMLEVNKNSEVVKAQLAKVRSTRARGTHTHATEIGEPNGGDPQKARDAALGSADTAREIEAL